MAVDSNRIQAVFLLAVEAADVPLRAQLLERECGADIELRQRVEALLAAHNASGGVLDRAFVSPLTTVDQPRLLERPGSRIGPYKLLQQLGEGGMGVVFLAEQLEPVRRKVAIKVIKPGMDTHRVVARFEAERQALALMDHPNIARVLDAGATDSGRPYFVMELVKGLPITKYCDQERLTPQERLRLFMPVCQAVQHAHQKGIIHRDLKPSNILIALYDGTPVPKVIDFGIAKATGGKLTDLTLFTEVGHAIGTWEYMAPEQAELNNLDIDTRADIYALGATLYELLTGSPPFTRQQLRNAAFEEMLRMIREVEPPKPSSKLSLSEELPSLATKRKLEPAKLSRMMRGDLDWIVMKCLEKERDRRYETANSFAADIQRHLHGEAVHAVPPSAIYRLRKFARKNRALLTTAAAFAVLLVTAAAVSGRLAMKAHDAEDAAEDRRMQAERSAREAEANLDYALRASQRIQDARVDAEVRNLSLQVDLNLAEILTDRRVGLLRLAQPMTARIGPIETPIPATATDGMELRFDENPEFRSLREFVTAVVLFAGQDYGQLLPPVTHDGHEVTRLWCSPDCRLLLTLGADATARTWETLTGRQIAILRKGNERVVNCGISDDGKTMFTEDEAGIARFFESQGGFLSQTPPHHSPNGAMIARDRFLAKGASLEQGLDDAKPADQNQVPYAELWDITTTKRIARWTDHDGLKAESFRFLGDGRWIAANEGESALAVFAAKDGKLAGRLPYPEGYYACSVEGSPSGRMISVGLVGGPNSEGISLLIWNTDTWQAATPLLFDYQGFGSYWFPLPGEELPEFCPWTDELVGGFSHNPNSDPPGPQFLNVCRSGQPPTVSYVNSPICVPLLPTGDFVLADGGKVFDTRTGQRLVPPVGHKYHPIVKRFAADGRFVITLEGLIDTRTEKAFSRPEWRPSDSYQRLSEWPSSGHRPGLGFLTAELQHRNQVRVRLLPTVALNQIPPDLLVLWLRVVLRGELGPDGAFVKWDEPTWEQKRQELAARPAPTADLPFPGHVANDRLHWLRGEFEAAGESEKPRLAKQLFDRAEATGDRSEANRWQKWHEAQPK
jgi:serine/threonine protein kinase